MLIGSPSIITMQSQQLAQMGSLPIFNQLCGSAFRFYTVKLKGNITSLLPALSGHVAPISDIFLLLHRQSIFMQVPSRNTSLTSSSQSFIDLLHLWFVSQAINRFPDFDGERYWCYMKPEENTADATLDATNQSFLSPVHTDRLEPSIARIIILLWCYYIQLRYLRM